MYDQFYGLEERPFSLLPDPDFLFLSEKHGTALDLLELAILNQSGFCVLSGEIGAGKTTLIRELLNRLPDNIQVGLVSNTHPSFGELMQWIMAAYGLECHSADRLVLHKHFIDYVIRSYADNKRTLLIIDEAQNLSMAAMEELRMLSNVNSDKDLVLQVILVGQQQLRDKLRHPRLEQFAQRIGLDFHLAALGEDETRKYIRYRIARAGGSAALFGDATCQMIYHASMGVPRLINRICDLALVHGFSEQASVVSAAMVQTVVNDQQIGDVLEAARHYSEAVKQKQVQAPEPGLDLPPETPEALVPEEVPEIKVCVEPERPAAAVAHDPAASATLMESRHVPSTSTGADREVPAPVSGLGEERVEASELHRLVVNAERKTVSARGWRKVAIPVAMSAALAGVFAAGWAGRDVWSGGHAGDWYRAVRAWLAPAAGTTRETMSSVSVPAPKESGGQIATPVQSPATVKPEVAVHSAPEVASLGSEPPAAVAVEPEPVPQAVQATQDVMPVAQVDAAIEQEAAITAAEQALRAEALRRETERLARLQEEAERLERERRDAERKFAEQLKARLALEQKMREERERMLQAREEAERIAAERDRTQQTASTTPVGEVLRAAEPEPGLAPDLTPTAMQIGESPVIEKPAEQSMVQSDSVVAVQGAGIVKPQATTEESGTGRPASTRFVANPCDGPTARFLSTCVPKKP